MALTFDPEDRIAYIDGAFVPLEDAKVSIMDRGFLFGDGVYEVTAVLGGKLVDFRGHVDRLARSLREIGCAKPAKFEQLGPLQRELLRRNHVREGLVYLQVTRGVAERDFPFPQNVPPTLVMFTQQKPLRESPLAARGAKAATTPDLRWARRDVKSIALLAQVLAKQAAVAQGCDEALMHHDGVITEGASSTVFMLTEKDELVTRPLSNEVLPSITRLSVMRLIEEADLTLVERRFTIKEALEAQELFIASASSLVTPLVSLDGEPIGDGEPGPMAKRLRALYIDLAEREAVG